MVTRNSPFTYYVGPHGLEGPDTIRRGFAEWLGSSCGCSRRTARSHRPVESDRAMAAAGLTVTEERAARVDFGPSYQQVSQQLVFRRGRPQPRSPADLTGRRIEVVADSSYVATLTGARTEVPELTWTENPSADASELLDKVAGGHADFTVVDSNIFNVFRRFYPELRVGFDLSSGDPLAWACPRRGDRSLIGKPNATSITCGIGRSWPTSWTRYYGPTLSSITRAPQIHPRRAACPARYRRHLRRPPNGRTSTGGCSPP